MNLDLNCTYRTTGSNQLKRKNILKVNENKLPYVRTYVPSYGITVIIKKQKLKFRIHQDHFRHCCVPLKTTTTTTTTTYVTKN